MNNKIKIGLVQYNPVWENKTASSNKISELLKDSESVDLLIFPEMTLTGFTMRANDFAEELTGESNLFFSSFAKEKKCAVMYGIIEKGKKKNFNTLVHLNNQGKVISFYRKIHPFSFANEDRYFGKGKNPLVTKVKGIKIGLSICYDLRFPELYRFYAKEKVHLIVDIANWPDTRVGHWRALLKARAIENQCYVVGVNRVGDDPKLHYNGYTSVFDPMGMEIVSAENEERIIISDIERNYVTEIRKKLPFLKDIRLI